MKNENNQMRVQMMRVEGGNLFPFVEIGYVDQEGNEHAALMVVDSCCCNNVLFGLRAERHGLVLQEEEGTVEVRGAGNEIVTTSLAKFHFVLGGEQFHESFCIKEGDIQIASEINDMPIIGIIGNLFMQQYHLAIDYSDYTLHTSCVSPDSLPISACDFFFPMEFGLERYGIPVVAVRQNGNDLVVLADTGATNNMMASQSITENGFDCRFLDSTDMITGIAGETEAKEAMMKFSLLTLTEDASDVMNHEDLFKVTPHYLLTPDEDERDENGVHLPPVVGIIGSSFMDRENWVLDFGNKFIYRRKADRPMDWNVRVKTQKKECSESHESIEEDELGNRRIRFYSDALEKGVPFIQIAMGDFEGIVMMIDTGSNDNLLFGYAYHQLEEYLKPVETQRNLYGLDGKPTVTNCARGSISLCGKEYEMLFLLREDDEAIIRLSQDMGFPVAGIIGTYFMAEHGWMIDFGRQEVVIPASDISSSDLAAIRKKEQRE